MELIKLEVYNYERFSSNPELKRVEFTPSKGLQVILGSNGSGKTSMLELFFGMPPSPDDILEDGYVRTTLGHNNSVYVLSSFREGDKVRYSFKIDSDEEVNTAHKVTTQRKLIEEHFNLTPEVLKLMLGNDSLTTMTKTKRKDWLIKSSNSDFTYILNLYDKVKKKIQYLKNVHSHTSKKLDNVLATPDELTEEQVVELGKLRGLRDEILLQFPELVEGLFSVETYERMTTEIERRARTIKKESIRLSLEVPSGLPVDTVTLDDVRHKIKLLSSKGDELQKELTIVYKKIESERTKLSNINDVPELEELEAELKTHILLNNEIEGSIEELSILKLVANKLTDTMDSYTGVTLLPDELQTLKGTYESKTSVLKGLESQLAEYIDRNKELKHLQSHTSITCPSCNTQFYTSGYDANEHNRVTESIKVLDIKVRDYTNELKVISDDITLNQNGIDYLRDIKRSLVNTRFHSDFHISPAFVMTDFKNSILSTITGMDIYQTNLDTKRNIQRIEDFIKLRKEVDDTFVSLREEVLSELDIQASTILNKREAIIDLRSRYELFNKKFTDLVSRKEQLIKDNETLKEYKHKGKQQALHKAMCSQLSDVRKEVASIEEIYHRSKERDNVIASLTSELEELQDTLNVHQAVEKSLCPKKGLIGVTVRSYMEAFIEIMNTHIKRVWETDLRLVMPDITRMDYSFPVKIENSSNIKADVSETSMGQKEIINLAYKLTMLQMLGFKGWPLILDEFGTALDKAHRVKAYRYIIELSESNLYSTVFMISHYADLYGALSSNTEYTILDEANIEKAGLPNKINTSFKRGTA